MQRAPHRPAPRQRDFKQLSVRPAAPQPSLITRQTTLQRDCNPDRHPSNSTTNRATLMRYPKHHRPLISAAIHHAGSDHRCRRNRSNARCRSHGTPRVLIDGADSHGDVRDDAQQQTKFRSWIRSYSDQNRIGDAMAVLSRSRRLALGSSWYCFLAAKNFLKADTPLSMWALTSIIPEAKRLSVSVQPDRSVDRLAERGSGRRALSMTRSLGERAVTNGRRSLTAPAARTGRQEMRGNNKLYTLIMLERLPT
jgi:hypothetical protein